MSAAIFAIRDGALIRTSIEAAFFDSVILSASVRSLLGGELLERGVDRLLVDVDLRQARLEVQRQGRAVADGVVEGVARQVAALVLRRPEPHEGVAVALVDRRAGQAEQERVRQRLAHLLPVVALLRAVRLVDHRDDVVAVVEHARRLAELVDRGDDDLPRALARAASAAGRASRSTPGRARRRR